MVGIIPGSAGYYGGLAPQMAELNAAMQALNNSLVAAIGNGGGAGGEAIAHYGLSRALSEALDAIEGGFSGAAKNIFSDFSDLSGGIDGLLSKSFDQLKSVAKNLIGGLLDAFLPGGLGKSLGGIFGFAGGGRLASRRPVLVGERGPEIFIPGQGGTVLNAADTKRSFAPMMAGLAAAENRQVAGLKPAVKTQVVVHNYSNSSAETRRRTGPGGDELIEVIIGRVADDLGRGGRVADAASQRFGLRARGA